MNELLQAHSRAKVVCVGRNYAAHALELGNDVPESPLLFIKPSTALRPFAGEQAVSWQHGELHYELELAVLIGSELGAAFSGDVLTRVAGYGLGLDLTRRSLQTELKKKGQPWERAKAFDGSCLLSGFLPASAVDLPLDLRLDINGRSRQRGNTAQMVFDVSALLGAIARDFTLLPGDVVLTGTPEGVGALSPGDKLRAYLGDALSAEVCLIDAECADRH